MPFPARLRSYALAACAFAALFMPAPSLAEQKSSVGRAFELAKPAVVYISMRATARLVVDNNEVDPEILNEAAQQLVREARGGRYTRAQLGARYFALIMNRITADPAKSTRRTGGSESIDTKYGWGGSGFIVSPDGYIVTNAHVANNDTAAIDKELLERGLAALTAQDVKKQLPDLSRSLGQLGLVLDEPLLKALTQMEIDVNRGYARLEGRVVSYSALMGVAGFANSGKLEGHPLEVTSAVGAKWPGRDVAILKMAGSELPALTLGDDTTLEIGARLHPIGYPFEGSLLSGDRVYDPTVTTGTLSARRPLDGWTALQTDAATDHGSSGGPVLDDAGNVVAITVAGFEKQGFNILVPVSLVKEYLKRVNVAWNQRSVFNEAYRQGYDAYAGRHYKKALPFFEQAVEMQPHEAYASDYVQKSRVAIAEGRSEDGLPAWVVAALIAVGTIALLGVTALVAFNRGRKRRTATSST